MKKILVSDYDDTLYTDEPELYKNLDAVKDFRKDNNLFVISTSRGYSSIMNEINKYNIPYDYLCVNNGAGILDNSGTLIYINHINTNLIKEIENKLQNYNNIEITRFYLNDIKIENKFNNNTPYIIENIAEILGYKIKGCTELLQELKKEFEIIVPNFDIMIKENKKLFLNNPDNNKEKAIHQLITLENLNEYKIYTVGDDDVDYNMLKQYNGYRMLHSSNLLETNINNVISSVRDLIFKIL